MSCAHVLAPFLQNLAPIRGDIVVQPAVADNGFERVGTLEKWDHPAAWRARNLVDVAIARVTGGVRVRNDIGVAGVRIRAVNHFTKSEHERAKQGTHHIGTVLKRGRTTDLTEGTVKKYDWHGMVDGSMFFDQIEVRGNTGRVFSKGGDSGSLVVEKDTSRVVGILLGGQGARSIVQPIWRMLAFTGSRHLEILDG